MSITEICTALAANKITTEEAAKLLSAAQAAGPAQALRFKVSEKGAVSVYGLQARFPVTLYGDQWVRLMAHREQLEAFMAANKGKLSVKPVKE